MISSAFSLGCEKCAITTQVMVSRILQGNIYNRVFQRTLINNSSVLNNLRASVGGSGSSSGRAVDYQLRGPRFESQSGPSQIFIAPLGPPNTKWVARTLKTWRK
ncbi:hypothetical protein PoB_000342400 [Plakobranchus ocellatus]|uniref:Uncharacterized protein n=1 Tax=Plakobranchus ocellatus TaxID=259542 RepID=A0AAV3Y1V0_9GAST|nr:hypothetical protein PoB_000342400 [Plakobranchus ocellatus]